MTSLTALSPGVPTGPPVPRADAAAPAVAAARHSGIVESVDADNQTLVVRELGANAVARRLRVRLAPDAPVVLSTREARPADIAHPFTDAPIALSDVRSGDFVVLDVVHDGADALADSVTVTLRGGA